MTQVKKKKKKSNWMEGFNITNTKCSEAENYQKETRQQINDHYIRGRSLVRVK